ncbi:hypothetical protein BuS5_01164 [Desulfosarcina sp. BuS5]|uniref:hypothetical protein n=1 Tax=Desulfosarcina sp. BuS5 TaxID=933262 RepID=UPI00048007B3|nr:hypothetical protein [Desulfosarcina sp. BuS5]WDN88196.1 hypothetical protein BuS5_01164 [Desulfosarcina sp. BuS5]
MAKIIQLQAYRTRSIELKAFKYWHKLFAEKYGEKTSCADISDKTLFRLASPGNESILAFYAMIMGILNLGCPEKFYYLSNSDQLRVLDIHLFLADNIRFELMGRLGWIEKLPFEGVPLIEIVQSFNMIKTQSRGKSPILSKLYPDYNLYSSLDRLDKETFIRLLLPDAIAAFKERLEA